MLMMNRQKTEPGNKETAGKNARKNRKDQGTFVLMESQRFYYHRILKVTHTEFAFCLSVHLSALPRILVPSWGAVVIILLLVACNPTYGVAKSTDGVHPVIMLEDSYFMYTINHHFMRKYISSRNASRNPYLPNRGLDLLTLEGKQSHVEPS